MEPEHIRFGGGPSATVLHPLVAVAVVLAVILVFCLPRKHVMVPLLLGIFLIPKGQQAVWAGLHFNIFRLIILAGLARWMASRRSEPLAGGFNFMDRVFTPFALSAAIVFILQWMQAQAVVKSLGDLVDCLGGYFVIRFLVRDREDVRRTIKVLAIIAIINAVCMLDEQLTGTNPLAFLGGVPGETVRDGKVRSQGTFEIFITAGSFGATLPALFVWLWSDAKSRIMSVLGTVSAAVMAVTCYASTTLVAYAAGVFALCLWPLRKQMRLIRWGIVFALVSLHLIMHGPVWSLLEHIDLTGSSSGYHRYMLIDNFIRHFGDWWLLGTKSNASWGWEMWDTSNQYVAHGLRGGLITLVLFLAIISRGFGKLGTARKVVEGNRSEEWFLWCLGAALFSHVVAYFGIGYFDQVQYGWYALLAIISVAVLEAKPLAAPQVQEALASSHEASPPVNWDMLGTNH
jgi:hypothetical protein